MIMPYSVSKTALLGLTKALSFELAQDNIRVNCVAPGIIDTKFAGAVSFGLYAKEFRVHFLHCIFPHLLAHDALFTSEKI